MKKLKHKILLFFYCLVFLFLFINRNFIGIIKGHNKYRELSFEVHNLEKDIKTLKTQISDLLLDDEYIEKIARKKYLMIKEGEEVFRFKKYAE